MNPLLLLSNGMLNFIPREMKIFSINCCFKNLAKLASNFSRQNHSQIKSTKTIRLLIELLARYARVLHILGGMIWPGLLLTAPACLLLGMEVPTTAAYAICVSVARPALIDFEMDPLTVHLFVFGTHFCRRSHRLFAAVISVEKPLIALNQHHFGPRPIVDELISD